MINTKSRDNHGRAWVAALMLTLCAMAAGAQTATDDVIDYSTCGYRASEAAIPWVTAAVRVAAAGGDSYADLQAALDYVASLPADDEGRRGAVLLDAATYHISQPLRIDAAGVVLRGRGPGLTTIVKTGVDRCAAIYIEGKRRMDVGDTLTIVGDVPAGATTLAVTGDATALAVGRPVLVLRPSTKQWIAAMGMDDFGGSLDYTGWKATDIDLTWHRTVTAVVPGATPVLTLDAPLTCAIDTAWGGGHVVVGHNAGEVSECGVEYLTIVGCEPSAARTDKDEDHCWDGISVDHAADCWVRAVAFEGLAGSAVVLQRGARRVTVEDCTADAPVSELGGWRRCTFLTRGEQTLIQRCVSHSGLHDFAAGYCAAGPNAFVQCEAEQALGFSGSIGSWACGLLFDIVDINGHDLRLANLDQFQFGTGWNAANATLWQCTASTIACYSPPVAAGRNTNSATGCWGTLTGDARWASSNNHVLPRSLFYDQLARRTDGHHPDGRLLPRNTSATSSPTIAQAAVMAHEALTTPRLTLRRWIDSLVCEQLLTAAERDDHDIAYLRPATTARARRHTLPAAADYTIAHGRLTCNGALLTGNRYQPPWWNGRTKDNYVETKSRPAITRFVPGRQGTGLTDRIDSVVTWLAREGYCLLDHNYGLWYDLRRTDHERVKRADGDVWAPFYEQPFARSGRGRAWDGLSLYDLTEPNRWYWARLKEFADKGACRGMLLFHENYFQHNILEAGAHWVDCPWRPVNNVNHSDFPEPVPFTGDKRVFMAQQFYDTTNATNTALHRQYIRMCLDQLKDCPNVVHLISEEYTGPTDFVRFWLQTIAQWETETGRHPLIALSCTKDAQDTILADATLAAVVDIIDIRYWHHNTDSLWAPPAGTNLSPRQLQRKHKAGTVPPQGVYDAVSHYVAAYPDKAVTYFAQGYADNGWAVLMAGGSLPNVAIGSDKLLTDLTSMTATSVTTPDGTTAYALGDRRRGYLVYSPHAEATIEVAPGNYRLYAVDATTGAVTVAAAAVTLAGRHTVPQGITWMERR